MEAISSLIKIYWSSYRQIIFLNEPLDFPKRIAFFNKIEPFQKPIKKISVPKQFRLLF